MTHAFAIEFLQEKGINLVAPRNAIEDFQPKIDNLEEILNRDIADTVTGFIVSWSKWNEMLQSDRAMLIMKELKTFDQQDEEVDEATNTSPENQENEANTENVQSENVNTEEEGNDRANTTCANKTMKAMLV